MACDIPTGPSHGRRHVFPQCGRALPVLGLACPFPEPETDGSTGSGSGSGEPEVLYPDLQVVQVLSPDLSVFSAGDVLTFTITTTNIGDALASGCTLVWVIPGLEGPTSVDLGTIGIGESVETIVVITLAEDQADGEFVMTSEVTTADEEPNLTNNAASTDFDVATPEAITDISVSIEELLPS